MAITGKRMYELIADLAADEPRDEILAIHGITDEELTAFENQHRGTVGVTRANIHQIWFDMKIADKGWRLAQYQSDVEEIGKRPLDKDEKLSAPLLKAKQSALRSAAEELGDLPRPSIGAGEDVPSIRIEVVGINPEDLV